MEVWSIKIREKRNNSLSASASFVRGIAELTRRALDKIFGTKIISFQMLGVSFYLSLASLYFFSLFAYENNTLHFHFTSGTILGILWYVALALVPALAPARWIVTLWYACFVVGLIWLLDFGYFAYKTGRGRFILGAALLSALAFGVSFACDVLYIALMRWLLRRTSAASTNTQAYHGLVAAIVCIIMTFVLFFVPVFLGIAVISRAHAGGRDALGLTGITIIFSCVFNTLNLLTTLLGFVLALAVLLHRMLWPLLQRPLYALQRYGVIRNKKLLWGLGISLLLLTPPGSLLYLVLHALGKL